jgi:O-antigen/teichoic acid export membrane protein
MGKLRVTQLKKNLLANFVGKGWTALMSLAFIPLYIKFMGIEAYGLVGVSLSLSALFSLLDLGLSTTINRELARLSAQENKAQEMRDLVRTLELIYWIIACVIGGAVIVLAPLVAHHWVKANGYSPETISQAVTIMGLALAILWPFSLYSGGLRGLQKQVLLNGIDVVMATIRAGGSVIVLWQVSPTILAFFIWQIFVSAMQTALTTYALWSHLPQSPQSPRFRKALLQPVWRFAAGMSAISAITLLLTQMDKIILSKLLSLEMFGYYTLAWVVASGLYLLVGPLFTGLFPEFSRLVAAGDQSALAQIYHYGCQVMSVVMLPAAIVLALFSQEILLLWTRNPVTVEHTYRIASLLVVGSALNGLMNLPYALQLAYGWTNVAFYSNVVATIALGPLIIFLAPRYGAVGGAIVWVILNSGYVLIALPVMHRRLLPGELRRWYVEDVGLPLLGVLATAGMSRLFIHEPLPPLPMLMSLVVVLAATLTVAVLTAPLTRAWAIDRLWTLKMACGG